MGLCLVVTAVVTRMLLRCPRRAGVRGDRAARALLLALATAAALSTPVPAATAGELRDLRYQIEVAGVQVGRVEVAAEAGDSTAEARVRWRVDGLLGLLDREKGLLEGRGRVDEGRVVPVSFESLFEKSDRRREVAIRYGTDGSIRDLELKRDGKRRRSEVPDGLREGTVDTITAFWHLRDWLLRAGGGRGGEGTRVAVFDGRRRYDLEARRLGREDAELDGREVEAERVELTLVPRSGFEDDEEVFGNRLDPDEPWADLLVAAGDDGVPLSLTGRGRVRWRIVLDEEGDD